MKLNCSYPAAAALALMIAGDAVAQGNGGGGGANKDLKVCIDLSQAGGLAADGAAYYCASDRGITAFVGRRRSITLELGNKRNQTRRLLLTLGSRVADIAGPDEDPDPNNDGGVIDQPVPGDWSTHPLPQIPAEGLTGEFQAAYRVNVLHMGEPGEEPNPNWRNARLRWNDADGREWTLLWGPHPQPGNVQMTNPNTPAVQVTRLDDGSGGLDNVWDVFIQTDGATERFGAHTAFLWRENSPNGALDYCGVFDVSFDYVAFEEP